jgi:uncharacterized membrane protein YedE/YeeE
MSASSAGSSMTFVCLLLVASLHSVASITVKPHLAKLRGGGSGEFIPIEAVVGGCFIGVASGTAMLSSSRVAGCSGGLRSLVEFKSLTGDDGWKVAFGLGLVLAGVGMRQYLPAVLEAAPRASATLAVGGLAVGLGTSWANGCTSGHGLSGLSKLSLRSLVAVCTFMGVGMATRTLQTGLSFSMVPLVTSSAVLGHVVKLALGFGGALPLVHYAAPEPVRQLLHALWSGACFGVGLAVGGMARPSAVSGALSPAALDLTLWTLFTTALAVTFGLYRLAEAHGLSAARADAAQSFDITNKLIAGSVLFGVGWALTGLCPGPLMVGLGAHVTAPGLLLVLAAFAAGAKLSAVLKL